MTAQLRLVMAQINPIVGDVAKNLAQIVKAAHQARDEFQADLLVFPELTLTGYPPEDLLLRPGLVKRCDKALQALQQQIHGIHIIIGHPTGHPGHELYNAASLIGEGTIKATYFKQHLPNYSVFDEKRYFVPGKDACVVELRGIRLGLTICEDIWFSAPSLQAVDEGAELIVNLNASPFQQGKWLLREQQVRLRTQESHVPVIYVNQVGGQDELVFDGCSFALSADGRVAARAPAFESGLYVVDVYRQDGGSVSISGDISDKQDETSMLYQGLVMGLRDYIEKNGFPGVVLGLSGGIDSALTLALAVDAIGAERVQTVMMPSRYTASISLQDAAEMAECLAVKHQTISIEPLFTTFLTALDQILAGMQADTTEENIQARCRGVLLMAISNKTGAMVLSTGNKSEMAVGYSTLYGDMAGGFSPLKDVYKTRVYELAEYRNSRSAIIPQRIIDRPPSAELSADQCDQDSLPPYELLDAILSQYIEDDHGFEELVKQGFEADTVASVIKMVDRNEYKRRQAPPGIRISKRAFGRDRRYPITSGYSVNSIID